MLFNSLAFAFLLGSNRFLVGFRRVPAFWVLLAASIVFYLSAGIVDLSVIAAAIVVNWFLQRLSLHPKQYITLVVVLNLGVLGFFKYRDFFGTDNFVGGSYADLALPLGISFYTFQMMAYHIDVVRKRTQPAPSFRAFLLFVSFYPQLVAGPIVRANQLLPQVNRAIAGTLRPKKFVVFGLALITFGLIKKVVLADSLGPVVDDIYFIGPDSFAQAWLGAILFSFQIYFDFSGYSDIAVGAAYLLGFRIPINFRTPYLSMGPAEFWRRWHITLSTWIQDYLYIPLGGSRGNRARVITVLIVTMGLAGLWHGASYTFIVWGAAWGVYILLGRVLHDVPVKFAPLRWLLHMVIVTILWVFFRAVDIGEAFDYIGVMFDFGSGIGSASVALWISLGIAGLFAYHWIESRLATRSVVFKLRRYNTPLVAALLVGISIGVLLLPANTQNPFIYFRF